MQSVAVFFINRLRLKLMPNDFLKFGETQIVTKTKLPDIIQATITSLMGPDCETSSNQLVLVVHDRENEIEYMGNLNISKSYKNMITMSSTHPNGIGRTST